MNNQQVQNFFYDKKDTPCPTAKGNLIIRDYCFDRICELVERV